MVGELPYNSWIGCVTFLAYSCIEVTNQDDSIVGWDVFDSVLKLVVEATLNLLVGETSQTCSLSGVPLLSGPSFQRDQIWDSSRFGPKPSFSQGQPEAGDWLDWYEGGELRLSSPSCLSYLPIVGTLLVGARACPHAGGPYTPHLWGRSCSEIPYSSAWDRKVPSYRVLSLGGAAGVLSLFSKILLSFWIHKISLSNTQFQPFLGEQLCIEVTNNENILTCSPYTFEGRVKMTKEAVVVRWSINTANGESCKQAFTSSQRASLLLRLQNIHKPAVIMTMFQGVSTIRELNIVKHITTITLGFAIAFVRDDVEISLVTLKRDLVVKVSREYY
ncbi:hypothetical protein P5673_020333 [Acropora cervicornis]|uniref:Uncharacterized protein n=1 Tax=Acropora cervicornis TaxID=6130 RepID=A0AAD9QA97_ACRCE|nr:hypothetical protein P5673_020333 [Acropora cervicornis]